MATKVLISGYIGFQNFGDDIIFEQLVKYLKSKNAYITAFSSNPKQTAMNYGVFSVQYNNFKEVIKQISKCDILFSGGGSLLQNRTSNRSLLYYLLIIFLAKLFGKKVVIFAQGIEGIKGFWQEAVTKFLLKKCNLITVRDKISQTVLRNWKINSQLLCDPFYDVKLPPYAPDGTIGIQVRESENLFPLFLDSLAENIIKLFPKRKIYLFIFQPETDETPSIALMMHLKNYNMDADIEIITNTSHYDTIKDFSKLEYLFAMRYHANLLGIKYGIKTMPITYDYKVVTLVNEYNLNYIDFAVGQDLRKLLTTAKKVENIDKKFDWSTFDYLFIERGTK